MVKANQRTLLRIPTSTILFPALGTLVLWDYYRVDRAFSALKALLQATRYQAIGKDKYVKTSSRCFIPTSGPEDCKGLLAELDKQRRTGYSAKALACCLEEAHGFPNSVQQVFSKAGYPH